MVLTKYKKFSLLLLSFWAVVLLAFMNWLAGLFYLYWTVGWFDSMTHFLAGLALGMFAVWLVFSSGVWKRERPTLKQSIFVSLLALIVIGVGWEIFEYVNGLIQSTEAYPKDVRNDLIADVCGAVLAGIISRWSKFYA